MSHYCNKNFYLFIIQILAITSFLFHLYMTSYYFSDILELDLWPLDAEIPGSIPGNENELSNLGIR